VPGHHDDRQVGSQRANPLENLDPVEVGHPYVEKHERRSAALHCGHSVATAADRDHLEPLVSQHRLDGTNDAGVVVDHENLLASSSGLCSVACRGAHGAADGDGAGNSTASDCPSGIVVADEAMIRRHRGDDRQPSSAGSRRVVRFENSRRARSDSEPASTTSMHTRERGIVPRRTTISWRTAASVTPVSPISPLTAATALSSRLISARFAPG
jgi:hypothetical protein